MHKFSVLFLVLLTFNVSVYSAQTENEKVLPKLDGVALQSEGSLYWLQFDEKPNSLWPTLIDFWAEEGIPLDKESPQLGFMETEWTQDLLVDRFLSVLLSDQAPVRRERFRLRVERLPENGGSRVFINHSAYGILFDEEATYTGYLPASPDLELEMLSRLALYSGADKTKIVKTVSSFAAEELTAKEINDGLYEIRVPGSVDFVQKRLIRALDRMNADSTNNADGVVVVTFNKAPELGESEDAHWGIDDNSDLEETGFPTQASDDGKPLHIVYQMTLSKEKSRTLVAISAQTGNSDEGDGLAEFSRALARDLQGK